MAQYYFVVTLSNISTKIQQNDSSRIYSPPFFTSVQNPNVFISSTLLSTCQCCNLQAIVFFLVEWTPSKIQPLQCRSDAFFFCPVLHSINKSKEKKSKGKELVCLRKLPEIIGTIPFSSSSSYISTLLAENDGSN